MNASDKLGPLIVLLFCCCCSVAQEPTKEQWISAMRSVKQDDSKLVELLRKYRELSVGVINGKSTGYDDGWHFENKKIKTQKLEEVKDLIAKEKKRLWFDTTKVYPQLPASSAKPGDVGRLVVSLGALTSLRPVIGTPTVGSDAAYQAYANAQTIATMVSYCKVFQVLGTDSFLGDFAGTTILIRGRSTKDLRDGEVISDLGLVYIAGNTTYETAVGTKTVMQAIQLSNATIDKLNEQCKAELASEPRLRTWTDTSGKFTVQAELIDFNGKVVILKKTDGTELKLALTKLSKSDREYAQEKLGAP